MQIILSEDEVKTLYNTLIKKVHSTDAASKEKRKALIARFKPYIK